MEWCPRCARALAPLGAQIRLALVFGSVARGTQSPGSDVDVLVLGSVGFAELAQALFPLHAELGREVKSECCALFNRRVRRARA